MVKDLYRYIWKVSARDQVLLSLLAVSLFLIELVPLELQRRIVNGAVEGKGWALVGTLCLVYAGVADLLVLVRLHARDADRADALALHHDRHAALHRKRRHA